ncbi:hypothetical protein IFM89_036002 [Coptis chinensis]|uniref:Uncharacterized protein n=1 Tax=Coptis chinensis TaxID=261450 RepID=A0A835MGM7_9MAGN|nr:hypothetical protein IFM89_036002 [Coptis chinensis]
MKDYGVQESWNLVASILFQVEPMRLIVPFVVRKNGAILLELAHMWRLRRQQRHKDNDICTFDPVNKSLTEYGHSIINWINVSEYVESLVPICSLADAHTKRKGREQDSNRGA